MPKRSQGEEPASPSSVAPRVNLKLLSEHLGLSKATISLVLNKAPLAERLSPVTRQRVEEAARRLGYQPNYFARSLSGKRSQMLGVLAPDFGEGYDSMLLSGMEQTLLNSGYVYFVSSHLWSRKTLDRSIAVLLERGAEGLIFINTPQPAALPVPTVCIGAGKPRSETRRVRIDNARGMELSLVHLAQLGHRRIALLKGHRGSSDTEERATAARRVMKDLGLELDPKLVVQLERLGNEGIQGVEEGQIATGKLLAQASDFTALVAFNDMAACGAMHTLQAAGRHVPEDVSIIGFDDLTVARVVQPALTTIRQPLRQMGEQAALLLMEAIAKKSTGEPELCIEPELIVRGSTAPPRKG